MNTITRTALSATFIVSLGLAALAAIPSLAMAQAYGGGGMNNNPATNNQPNLPANTSNTATSQKSQTGARAAIAKSLTDAQDLSNKKDFQGALAKIKEADAITDKTPYEEYVVARTLGYVDIQLQDVAGATAAYNRVLASNGVPADNMVQTLKIVMQLNSQQKDYAKAISAGEQLAKLGPLDTTTTILLGQLYYLNGDYANSLRVARAAVDAQTASGGNADDRLLTVLEEAQIKMGDQAGAKKTLEMRAQIPGSSANFGVLISEAEHKTQNHHQLLQLNRLRLLSSTITAQDFIIGAQLALEARFFREAHDLIDKGINAGVSQLKKLSAQASSGTAAEEKSLPALERAASASSTGELDVTLGETYMTYGRYAEAQAALERGIGKGGVKNGADAEVTLGIVLMKEGKKDDALKAFAKAAETPSEEPIAHVWTLYVQHG